MRWKILTFLGYWSSNAHPFNGTRLVLARVFTFGLLANGIGAAQIWATAQQNQQNDVCPAKTQISLGIRPVGSEPSLCTQ